jgi:hypothetical protein
MWKKHMPPNHTVIGVKRNLKDVLKHYARRASPPDRSRIEIAYHIYNTMLEAYNVPIIRYEDVMKYGPVIIEDIVELEDNLPDVREKR